MSNIIRIIFEVLLAITSCFLVLLILMHKGKGGGMSDMFGGGMTSNLGSSGVAEKNLNRVTVVVSGLWLIAITVIGVLGRSS